MNTLTDVREFPPKIALPLQSCCNIIFLDFQKVFDKIPHIRLMAKVIAHGIEGHIWKCIVRLTTGLKIGFSG